jgi:cytochrome c biogenesis protein CcmG/thiol:disulfide interchange protein DsbE
VVAVGVAVAIAAGYLALRPAGDSVTRASVGRPAPLFVTTDLQGRRVSLSDYRGQPVMLNFWASWCTPCRQEFPLLKQYTGAQVLGVIFDDSADNARRFMAEQRATWPGLVDPNGRIAAAYGVAKKPGIPVTVFIDARGKVTGIHLGPLTAADLHLG